MTDTYIQWLLIITGVFTAASVGVFLQPVKQVALIYGENLMGTAGPCSSLIGGCLSLEPASLLSSLRSIRPFGSL
jgi:hypothetical protein